MRSRILLPAIIGLILGLVGGPLRTAQAQRCTAASVMKLKKLNFDSMDEIDRWELEKALLKLDDARLVAQTRKCQSHPELAVSYVLIGIVNMKLRKRVKMVAAWRQALKINPRVRIPRRVASAKVKRLFANVKARAPRTVDPRDVGPVAPPRPTGPPKGLEHLPLVKWEEGKTLTVEARVALNLGVRRLSLFFQPGDAGTRQRMEFKKGGGDKWTWRIVLPGTKVRGAQFKYYIVAYTAGNKEVAASGNSANMHIVQLTKAVLSPRRASGEENPLTGGVLPRRVAPARRAGPDHPLENPDAATKPRERAATPDAGVKKHHVPEPKSEPIFFAALGLGTGIGMMHGRTEVTNEPVPSSPSLGSLYGQLELGYLITQNWSINVFGRFGYMFISKEVKDPQEYEFPEGVTAKGNDKEVLVLARIRYQSNKLLRADLPVNLKWHVGGGLGWGILRHLVNGKHPITEESVVDTDRSTGFVPNVFGGLALCVVQSCQVNIFFEVNYLAAFTSDTDLNTYLHLDFTLGANFAF